MDLGLSTGESACAVALFDGSTGSLVWCNDRYLALLDPPRAHDEVVGTTLADFDPVFDAAHPDIVCEVARSGRPQSAEDRLFSVEDGHTVYRWSFQAAAQGLVLLLLESYGLR